MCAVCPCGGLAASLVASLPLMVVASGLVSVSPDPFRAGGSPAACPFCLGLVGLPLAVGVRFLIRVQSNLVTTDLTPCAALGVLLILYGFKVFRVGRPDPFRFPCLLCAWWSCLVVSFVGVSGCALCVWCSVFPPSFVVPFGVRRMAGGFTYIS